mgnify:FL=1
MISSVLSAPSVVIVSGFVIVGGPDVGRGGRSGGVGIVPVALISAVNSHKKYECMV